MRTRIKICGITRAEDAAAAAQLGADALGFVFHPASPRALTAARAAELAGQLPPFVTVVALFMDTDAQTIRQVVEQLQPDLLQFHGTESPAFCAGFDRPYIKAVPMGSPAEPSVYAQRFAQAHGLLLDSHAEGQAGGSGKSFASDKLTLPAGIACILAGGLEPGNVARRVRALRPYGVDVSSGVEDSPGIKSREKMQQFIEAVKRADDD